MLDDVALFVRIATFGGLSKAAEQIDVPAATVTRHLQRLEHQLGCKLVNRSARQFSLTPEGQLLLDDCGFMVESLQDRMLSLQSSLHDMSGRIKIIAPVNMTIGLLQPIWAAFMKKYPDVTLDFVLNNETQDFLSSQADFAICVEPVLSPSIQVTKIGETRTVLVASPAYVEEHGAPQTPEDLIDHDMVVASWFENVELHHKDSGCVKRFRPNKLRGVANELSMVRNFCCDGMGISMLPIPEVRSEIQSGTLVYVLPEWEGRRRSICLVWPSNARLTRRSQTLVDDILTAMPELLKAPMPF